MNFEDLLNPNAKYKIIIYADPCNLDGSDHLIVTFHPEELKTIFYEIKKILRLQEKKYLRKRG